MDRHKAKRVARFCVMLMVGVAAMVGAADHPIFIDGQDIGIRSRYKTCLDEAGRATEIIRRCVDDEFKFQDDRLNSSYQRVINAISKSERDSIRTEQRSWIKWRDAICATGQRTEDIASLGSRACLMRQAAVQATALEEKSDSSRSRLSAPADELPLSGVWSIENCKVNGGAGPNRCTSLHLTLFEHDGYICGMHVAATSRLARIDEGDPPSVMGATTGRGTALVNIVSGRTGNAFLASLRRSGDKVSWTILGPVVEARDSEPSMLPAKVNLTRDRSLEAADELASFKKTCKWPD